MDLHALTIAHQRARYFLGEWIRLKQQPDFMALPHGSSIRELLAWGKGEAETLAYALDPARLQHLHADEYQREVRRALIPEESFQSARSNALSGVVFQRDEHTAHAMLALFQEQHAYLSRLPQWFDTSGQADRAATGDARTTDKVLALARQLDERGIESSSVDDLVLIMGRLGNFAWRAVRNGDLKPPMNEKAFQRVVRDELARDSRIGSELYEHLRSAGGSLDLVFRRVPIELKVEPHSLVELADCDRYLGQAASYAVGLGSPVAALCVLDLSPKWQAARDTSSLLELRVDEDSGVVIFVVVVQGNLPRPSDLSR